MTTSVLRTPPMHYGGASEGPSNSMHIQMALTKVVGTATMSFGSVG